MSLADDMRSLLLLLLLVLAAWGEEASDIELLCNGTSSSLNGKQLMKDGGNFTVDPKVIDMQCRVKDVINLTLGSAESTTTINCIGSPISNVFSFVNATSLTLQNILFVGCGAPFNTSDVPPRVSPESTEKNYLHFGLGQSAVLLCTHCSGLSLQNVTFTRNTGYAFVGINLHGNSALDRITVKGENDLHYPSTHPACEQYGKYACKNRGMILLFVDTNATESLPINVMSVPLTNSVFDSNLEIDTNSTEEDSHCVREAFELFIDSSPHNSIIITGLGILFKQERFAADVTVESSNFTNNHGDCNGAILLLMLSTLATQSFLDCHFFNNSPNSITNGNGNNNLGNDMILYIQCAKGDLHQQDLIQNETLAIVGSRFEGLYRDVFVPSITVINFPSGKDDPGLCAITLEDIQVNVSSKFLHVSDLLHTANFQVALKDIRIEDKHSSHYNLQSLDQGSGLLTFIEVDNITILGTSQEKCLFSHLLGPVIFIRYGSLFLTGEMLFTQIYGSNWASGAAILVESGGILWLQEPLQAIFSNNTAVKGGAIASDQLNAEFCFIQYIVQDYYDVSNLSMAINVTFSYNTAQVAGNSIYADNIYNCSTRLSPNINVSNLTELYKNIFHFEDEVDNQLSEITSSPKQICLCEANASYICVGDSLHMAEIVVYPGESFPVSIIGTDDVLTPVFTNAYNVLLPRDQPTFSASFDFKWRLDYDQNLIELRGYNCTNISFSILTDYHEDTSGILAVYPFGQVHCLAFPVTLKECPRGFELMSQGWCGCCDLFERHHFTCNISSGNVTKSSSFSWVGVVNDGEEAADGNDSSIAMAFSKACPLKYCRSNLRSYNLETADAQCRYNRSGVLCGSCPGSLSTVIGYPSCQVCSNLWLLTIPLYIVAGVVMVIVLFLLRLTVAAGTINGLIFFANVFNINTYHILGYDSTSWLRIFVSILNLKLGFPLCLYNGLTAIASSYLSIFMIVYLWVIVFGIVFLSRRSQRISNLVSRSAIPVLATIVHLSFAKLLRLVVEGLMFAELLLQKPHSTEVSSRTVWFLDGNVTFLEGPHLGLFIISLFCLLFFLIPYTVFFTGVKWFIRFKLTNHIRPFIDAFCGPFKDKWRFWFGIRLWVLVILYIAYAGLRSNPELLIFMETIFLLFLTLVQVAIMPYKSALVNFLDTFFLVDCLLIHMTSIYTSIDNMEIPSQIYVSAAFMMFCVIIVYHIHMVFGDHLRAHASRLRGKVVMLKKADGGDEVSSGSDYSDESEKRSLHSEEHRHHQHHQPATYSSLVMENPYSVQHYKPDELREPLIDED